MTILQSLAAFYDRLERRGEGKPAIVPPPGLKPVEIDYVLEIDRHGRPVTLKQRHIPEGRRRAGKLMMPGTAFNPKPERGEPPWEDLSFGGRTSGRRSYLLWDKTSYVFGVAAKKSTEGGKALVEADISKKSKDDHAAFVAAHKALLADTDVPELRALLIFLDDWRPEHWSENGFPPGALDRNIAFEVSGTKMRLDQMLQARQLAAGVVAARTIPRHCLVSGEVKPFAPRHPQFKGVLGAQSSGASLVSYNADAFVSFDADKAATAPVSEEAAFKYGAALNWLLDRDNGRVFRLGETTVVFWADEKSTSGGDDAATEVEEALREEMTDAQSPAEPASHDADDDSEDSNEDEDRDIDQEQGRKIEAQAQDARHMRRRVPDPSKLDPATRLHVLGLSPNAGRIAVRFWLVDTWGHIAENLARFKQDMSIEPPDRVPDKKAYALLFETAVQGKPENIPKRLGGEFARAILSGNPYPMTLFAAVVARIRADKRINTARAGLCKAFVMRNFGREDFPVALDIDSADGAYNLGRLFAVYEYAEKSVADRNATIRDKFIGAASATPRRVFPILMRGYEHNASALAKGDGNKRGAGVKASKTVSQILGRFGGEMPFPTALRLEDQGRFFVGYYHQMQALYTKADSGLDNSSDTEDTEQ